MNIQVKYKNKSLLFTKTIYTIKYNKTLLMVLKWKK